MNFKKFAIGLAIMILAITFIAFTNQAINKEPKNTCYNSYNGYNSYNNYKNISDSTIQASEKIYENCLQDYDQNITKYRQNSFITITALSVLALIAGVLVMAVPPISWGLVLSGLIMIIFIFLDNFDSIGKPYRAIISGLALAILIWLAYAKLGDKDKINPVIKEDNSNPGDY